LKVLKVFEFLSPKIVATLGFYGLSKYLGEHRALIPTSDENSLAGRPLFLCHWTFEGRETGGFMLAL